MRITPDNADADCRIGEPAPRNADTVWHYDLEKIEGGERCLECGTVFRRKAPRRKKPSPAPVSNVKVSVSDERFTPEELNSLFPDGVPMVLMKLLFAEKSEKPTNAELRQIAHALSATPPSTRAAVSSTPSTDGGSHE